MNVLYNKVKYKNLRKDLRKNQTEVEKIVWSKLRNKQINGLKFYRQFGVGNYIVDFYCPEIKLAIEIDGGQHEENIDREKTEFLKSKGIFVLRFWNNEVLENLEGLYELILETVNNFSNSSLPPLAKRR